jgi:hypothetical protein
MLPQNLYHLVLAVITVYRQKLDGLYGKTYASLAIGLGL